MRNATLFIAALLLCASLASAQPTRQWQRVYRASYDGSYFQLLRLSRNRLVGMGSRDTAPVDTVISGAGLWFYNNAGDTVRTRLHLAGRRISSQNINEPHGQFLALAVQPTGHLLGTGIILAGTRNSLPVPSTNFIMRLDSVGNILWSQNFRLNNATVGQHTLLALPDGGALLSYAALYPGSQTATVAAVARFDSTGTLLWQRTYGRAYSLFSRIAPLVDGSFALAGFQARAVPGTSYVQPDVWLLRITASGDTIRSRYYGGDTEFETLRDLQPAPHGGLLLTTVKSIGVGANVYTKAWLMQLDSLGRVQWQHLLGPASGALAPSFDVYHGRPLANGRILLSGQRNTGQLYTPQLTQYLALYQPTPAGGATPIWEQYTHSSGPGYDPNYFLDLSARGELTLAGTFSDAAQNNSFAITRLSSVEPPYIPNLCQTPPQAQFGFAPTPGGDSLRFVSVSTPGPQYAQFVRWHWDFGDGTTFDGPTPPPHRFPTAGAGTAVRLTVTNNLGCTSTVTVFPFALATAAQRALQARLSVFPNPATGGAVTVQLLGLRPQAAVAGELLNALGQTVRHVSWPAAQLGQGAELPVSGLAAGVYTLRLRPQEGALVKRLVVQ